MGAHSYDILPKEAGVEQAREYRARSTLAGLNSGTAPMRAAIPAGHLFQDRDGQVYTLRRVTAADAELLAAFVCRLSEQTRWLRYMTARPCSPVLARAEAARMAAGAAGDLITLIATQARGGSDAVVAVAELACDHQRGTGEVGVVVMDDVQRKGIGSLLLRQLMQIAQELGLARLHGDMFAANYAIQRLIRAHRLPYTATIAAGEMQISVQVPA